MAELVGIGDRTNVDSYAAEIWAGMVAAQKHNASRDCDAPIILTLQRDKIRVHVGRERVTDALLCEIVDKLQQYQELEVSISEGGNILVRTAPPRPICNFVSLEQLIAYTSGGGHG